MEIINTEKKMEKKEECDKKFFLDFERRLLRRKREEEKWMKIGDKLIKCEGKFVKYLLRNKKKEEIEQKMRNLTIELSRQQKILSDYDKEIKNADNQLRDYITAKRNEVEAKI